jgi:hypothetical protein
VRATLAKSFQASVTRGPAVQVGVEGEFQFDGVGRGHYRAPIVRCPKSSRGRTVGRGALNARTVDGRVVERLTGAPVARASVRLSTEADSTREAELDEQAHRIGRAARTNFDGRFRLTSIPAEETVIRVDAEGYVPLEVELPANDGDWTLQLETSGAVSGDVRGPAKYSVEGLRVSVVRHHEPMARTLPSTEPHHDETPSHWQQTASRRPSYTDEEGFYQIYTPGFGSWRVVVEGAPYAAATSHVIETLDARTELKDVDISLSLAATVQGVVVGQNRGGLAGARILVMPVLRPDETNQVARSTAEHVLQRGRGVRGEATETFLVPGLREGPYRVVASATGFNSAQSETIELVSGITSWVELDLEPEMTIVGRTVLRGGEPIAAVDVVAVAADGGRAAFWREERTQSGTLGIFRLTRLASRNYNRLFQAKGYPDTETKRSSSTRSFWVPAGTSASQIGV